jgi:transcriptional regulator with XRE-family HTH domain
MSKGNNGQAIRERRKQLGLSGPELAALIGVDTSTISRYEKGEMGIRRDRLIPLANALGMNVSDLVDLAEFTPPEPDDYERLCTSLRSLGVIRPDGSVSFERFAQVELLLKTIESFNGDAV